MSQQHSIDYMLNAQKELSLEIDKLNFLSNNINIISNFNAKISNESVVLKNHLKIKWPIK